jgi:hypothetical protein
MLSSVAVSGHTLKVEFGNKLQFIEYLALLRGDRAEIDGQLWA